MTRRAARGPMGRTFDLLLAVATGCAVILLGCGGGGGGGGNGGGGGGGGGGSQACGSASTSTAVVVCGFVKTADANQAAVQGAVVTLKDATGTTVTSGGQPVTTTTDANGRFEFDTVPSNAKLFAVDPPSPAYYQNEVQYINPVNNNAAVYGFMNRNQANTAPCFPPLPALTPGDHQLNGTTGIGVYPQTSGSPPPPPPFGCPI